MTEVDVVVVGAGIGGAVLALAMAQRGWTVVVVEKEPAPRTIVRPEVLWGGTLRLLDTIGIGEVVRNAAILIQGVEMRRSGTHEPLLAISQDDLVRAGVEGWSTNPTVTRSRILDAGSRTGRVRVDRSVEILELSRDGDRIVGAVGRRDDEWLHYRSRLVIGDDGVRSVVRSALGFSLELKPVPLDFVSALIEWPRELAPDHVRIWLNPPGFTKGLPGAGFIPWPGGPGVMLLPVPHDRVESILGGSPEAFWRALSEVTPLASELSRQLVFPRDFERVRRPFGHVDRYVAPGAALIGDAVHPMTPAGGQGANASIADAMTLAAVADDALRANDVSAQRLGAYEHRRRVANQRSVGISATVDRLLRTARFFPGIERLVPLALRVIDRFGLPRRGVRYFATAFESDS